MARYVRGTFSKDLALYQLSTQRSKRRVLQEVSRPEELASSMRVFTSKGIV